jgi:hypothetical protein
MEYYNLFNRGNNPFPENSAVAAVFLLLAVLVIMLSKSLGNFWRFRDDKNRFVFGTPTFTLLTSGSGNSVSINLSRQQRHNVK